MRRLIISTALAALVLAPSARAQTPPQSANAPAVGFTHFVDPTENAFAVDVPEGWQVQGGVMRVTLLEGIPWVAALSPDGGIELFINDPAVPAFKTPTPKYPEGAQIPSGQLRPATALAYHPGAAFAQLYGPPNLAAQCAHVTAGPTQPAPDFARLIQARASAFGMTQPHEAGLATFSCEHDGRRIAAGVLADTAVLVRAAPIAAVQGLANAPTFDTGGDLWSATVAGYVAPAGQEALAYRVLTAMLASRQFNPTWDDAQKRAAAAFGDQLRQQSAAASQQMQAQSQAFTQMLLAQGEAAQEGRNRAHAALMQQMQQQSADRNRQFAEHMLAKDWAAQQWIRYAGDRKLVCNQYGCWEVSTR